MKKTILFCCMASLLLFSSCFKNPILQQGKPTFSLKIGPVNTANGAATTITEKDCYTVTAQAVVSDGKTVVTILGQDRGGGVIVNVNIAIEGAGKGIYSQHPIASMDGTYARLPRSPQYGFATDDDHNIGVEFTRFDGAGGTVTGTINANAHHLVDANTGESEQLDVIGSYSIPRTY